MKENVSHAIGPCKHILCETTVLNIAWRQKRDRYANINIVMVFPETNENTNI